MAVDWPLALGDEWHNGTKVTPRDTRIRSPMDVGIPKVRRRGTFVIEDIIEPVTYLEDQVDTLRTLINTTLKNGTLRIERPHPISGDEVEMRIVAMPQFEVVAGGLNPVWTSTLHFEVLPT
jgi:hypothetical protein